MRSFALLLGVVLTSAGALPAQGPATVAGIVTDESGVPVREVLVVIDPDSLSLRTRTGVDGRYSISVPTGRYEVRVVRIGYKPQSHTITVTAPSVALDVQLQGVAVPLSTVTVRVSRPGLHGQVVTRGIELLPHEPRPLRGASIEVLNEPYSVKTEADGRFSLPQLPIGSHTILVTLDRYATRMAPVTVPPEGGIQLTFTLDSLYAEYQFREQDQLRGISWRMHRAESPATFVSAHELDPEATNVRDALRYAHSVLSRGIILQNTSAAVFVDGRLIPYVALHELAISDIAGVEVYPANSLQADAGVINGNTGLPVGELFSSGERGRGSFSNRTLRRTRGNSGLVIMIWTNKRR